MKTIGSIILFSVLLISFMTGFGLSQEKKTPLIKHLASISFTGNSELPDFASYTNTQQKKTDFFLYLLPKVTLANADIMKERTWVTALNDNQTIEGSDLDELLLLAKKYKVKTDQPKDIIEALIVRIDIIPPSLVLAQAANESAWGTSRFAKQGNNLFGQWCYVKGCGIVPKGRAQGKTNEVASFKGVQQSVASYMRNLNSQYSYEFLRELRLKKREQNETVGGAYLAQGLIKYSTRREEYVKEIRAMIRQNSLAQFD